MNFQVPQFIEIEDKIFGPLTFKQFIYLAGGGGLAFLCYVFLPLILALIPIVAIVAFSLALAFYKINNRPFVSVIESGIKYIVGPKMYVWKKTQGGDKAPASGPIRPEVGAMKKISHKRLEDLAWSLDVKETIR